MHIGSPVFDWYAMRFCKYMNLHAGLDAVANHDEEASWLTLTIFCQSHAQSTNAWQDVG